MITVTQALENLFDLVSPLETEDIPLLHAVGRVLARPVAARLTQPPFAASAMDGYAIQAASLPNGRWHVIGEAAAGRGFAGHVGAAQAVRIFTGAPLPAGTDHVLIQENVECQADLITLRSGSNNTKAWVRPAGNDFAIGDTICAPRRLTPRDIALLAAMNIDRITVTRRPEVALISTGDELIQPGETPGPSQIIASNGYGLHAMLSAHGALPRLLPIARDRASSLRMAFEMAKGADLIVTIGGASVGDHDLVAKVAADIGMQQAFYKVRMRPGKPLMAGRLLGATMIGLPGNPVSAMVCGEIFLKPVIDHMQGLAAAPRRRLVAPLAHDVPANGEREHYMRGKIEPDGILHVYDRQDSALLGVLQTANALIIRPPNAPLAQAGDIVKYITL